jgi:hypothetical protein
LVRTACYCSASKVGMVARVVYIWDVSLAQRGGVEWESGTEKQTRKNEGSAAVGTVGGQGSETIQLGRTGERREHGFGSCSTGKRAPPNRQKRRRCGESQ